MSALEPGAVGATADLGEGPVVDEVSVFQDRHGFIDIRVRDRLDQVFLESGLQAIEERAVVEAAAGFHVEKRRVGTRRILQPVAGLVAVGVEQEVVEALHDVVQVLERLSKFLRARQFQQGLAITCAPY
jgi:hypothetical protein